MVKLNKATCSLGMIMILSACGQNPVVSNPYAQVSPYSTMPIVNPMVNPLVNSTGIVNPIVNTLTNPLNPVPGYNPFTAINSIASVPIYVNQQLVGTRTRKALLGGSSMRVHAGHFEQTIPVLAGDHLVINLGKATYGVARGVCVGTFGSVTKSGVKKAYALPLTASFNGSVIGEGLYIAPAAGNLTIAGDLDPVDADCGGLFNHRPARVLAYFVSLSSTGNEAVIGSNTVEVEKCTATAGTPMDCPVPAAQTSTTQN